MSPPRKLPTGVERRSPGSLRIWWIDSAGRRRRETIRTSDVRLAERIRSERVRQAALASAGLAEASERVHRLSEIIGPYLAARAVSLSRRHAEELERELPRMVARLGDPYGHALRAHELAGLASALAATGRSNRTANKLAGLVATMHGWAQRAEMIGGPTVRGWQRLPEGGRHRTRERAYLSPAQAIALQAAADEHRARGRYGEGLVGDLVASALGTGMRLGEMMALRWDDVRRDAIRVRGETTKTGRPRTIPIREDLAGRLSRRRSRIAALTETVPAVGEPVFGRPSDLSPMTRSSEAMVWRWLMRVIEASDLERVQPDGRTIDWHALRHTYCAWLIGTGAAPQAVQAIMGHRSIRMTMEVYADLDSVPTRAAVDRLPDLAGDSHEAEG